MSGLPEINAVEKFFSSLKQGDIEGAIDTVHEEAEFSAPGPDTVPIYNTFHGKEGVRQFILILGELFDTEVFEIYDVVEKDYWVFATGLMKHRVKKTGKLFECEWALVSKVKDDKIVLYKMFEDTSALERAYTES